MDLIISGTSGFLMPCKPMGQLTNDNDFCGSAAMPVTLLLLGFHFTNFSRRLGLRICVTIPESVSVPISPLEAP
eukprot:474721-Pyramimonas_sp.AAC.1